MGFLAGKNDIHYNASATPLQQSQYGDTIQGAQGAAANTAPFQANQGSQAALANALLQQSQGNGPAQALVNNQLTQATNAGQQQAAGLIGSQKGMNPALQARMILQNQANVGQQAANQSAQNQANIALNSQGQAANVLGTMGNQDLQQQQNNIGLLGTSGGLQNQQNSTNVQNTLGTNALNSQAELANQSAGNAITGGLISGIAGAGASFLGKPAAAIAGKAHGGPIEGSAPVPGDSPKNDTVPAMLSPKEIVLPRSVTMSEDAPEKAKAFVTALLGHKNKAKEKPKANMSEGGEAPKAGYGKVLAMHKELAQKLAQIEKALKASG